MMVWSRTEGPGCRVGRTEQRIGTNGGADALLRNLAQDYSQQEGATISSDLCNLLNTNLPGDEGDLAANWCAR